MADGETCASDAPRALGDPRLVSSTAPGPAPDPGESVRRWPVTAIVAVVASSSLALVMMVLNIVGIQLGEGAYDADTGGSVAEWFGALATLVTIPLAVFLGLRQLRSTTEALELGRRQLAIDEIERAGRRGVEQALLRDAVRLAVRVDNVVDGRDLATDAELAAVERWRDEYRQRGWVPDESVRAWQQGSLRRTNAEQLAGERSPILPKPWFLAVECRNTAGMTVFLQRWTVQVDGVTTTVDLPVELRHGERHWRRLGADVGLATAYPKPAEADARAREVTVVADGRDAAGRPFRISYPRWE
jgi:hypothetical protein